MARNSNPLPAASWTEESWQCSVRRCFLRDSEPGTKNSHHPPSSFCNETVDAIFQAIHSKSPTPDYDSMRRDLGDGSNNVECNFIVGESFSSCFSQNDPYCIRLLDEDRLSATSELLERVLFAIFVDQALFNEFNSVPIKYRAYYYYELLIYLLWTCEPKPKSQK